MKQLLFFYLIQYFVNLNIISYNYYNSLCYEFQNSVNIKLLLNHIIYKELNLNKPIYSELQVIVIFQLGLLASFANETVKTRKTFLTRIGKKDRKVKSGQIENH